MDTFDNQTAEFAYHGPLSARMACHMGDNKASAICNLLGDQPLFYIDYVDPEEADFIDGMNFAEDEMMGEFNAEGFEHLRRRMERLEGAGAHIDAYKKDLSLIAFDAAIAQLGRPHADLDVAAILAFLNNSRFAAQMLIDATAAGLTIITSAMTDKAFYDREAKCIHVNPRLPVEFAALATARALRQAWLHMNGAAIHPLHFAPEEAVLLNRIQQADLCGSVLRTAWEFKLGGHTAPWARILTGSSYDLAVSFAREAIADFRALNNGSAANAVFEKWFFSGRCKDVDRKLIQSMLADQHGLVFDHPHVSKMVTADIIARTGDMPLGKNYLTGLVEIILADPLFTEVRDRANANFLWFIKFERSFRATEEGQMPELEQTLQGVPAVGSSATPSSQGASHASVVAFTGITRKRKTVRKGQVSKLAAPAEVATVYYLDHFLSLSNR